MRPSAAVIVLHECLQGYPGHALELRDGVIIASNGLLEAALGREIVRHEFEELLEPASLEKWRAYQTTLASRTLALPALARRPVELALVGPARMLVQHFVVAAPPAGEGERHLWLLADQPDPILNDLVTRLADAHTELARIHRELERERARLARALSAAEAAVHSRDEILAIVAHDLQNPLAGISMTVDLLLQRELPPERHRLRLASIRDAAARVHRIVRNLLEVALVESGQLPIEPRPTSVAALLHDAAAAFDVQAQHLGISLAVEPPHAAVAALADPVRIQRVLGNLLDNALRHTPRGGRVTLAAVARDDHVQIDVADTGAGLAPEEIPNLFRRFWQSRRSTGGSAGLGLAIAKGLVEAHHGVISARSTPGAGSVFTFTLPRAEDQVT